MCIATTAARILEGLNLLHQRVEHPDRARHRRGRNRRDRQGIAFGRFRRQVSRQRGGRGCLNYRLAPDRNLYVADRRLRIDYAINYREALHEQARRGVHEHAVRAGQAAVEAARQGAFWPYHDLLFRNGGRLTDADLVGYADSLGLDDEAFADALADGRHAGRVEADRLLGASLAVTGTPTFFVNGYRIVGTPPIWVFELALEAFREGRVESRRLAPPRPPEDDGRAER